MTTRPAHRDKSQTTSQKMKDAKGEHFEKKAHWKSRPENRHRLGEATPMDKLQLVTKPQPGGLVLDWA